ncbi:hypothetical protein [uncultured Psychroserpens sp.]|uniref:hypothetical protein n=1 Tax=uncultured Psychroserpens sp. TaxID=255436 RepID=UPI00260571C8|nr:hypothetical protein [uncultured Psychroserpens sp.]
MKNYIHLLLFICPILLFSQSNPFAKLKYDKVVAYEFQGEGDVLIIECLKNQNEKINKNKALSKKETQSIEHILTSEKAYGKGKAFCFDPHFAIVYYLKDEIVCSIDICLDCNSLVSSIKIPATKLKYIKIGDDYSYPADGFSKISRKHIYEFCKALNFVKYLKPLESIYDD